MTPQPRFAILFDRRVIKVFKRLQMDDAARIYEAIERLADDPYPPGARKLTNRTGWRIRVGDYRILYKVESDRLIVFVFRAGHRREVYD